MANQINLEFQLGETWILDFNFNDEADADLDLSGAVIDFIMSLGDVEVFTMSSSDSPSGIAIDCPTIGLGSIIITPSDQVNFTPNIYNYEIQATLADQSVSTQIFGSITVLASLFAWPIST